MSDRVDCVVIGAGVVGCATALQLSRAGLSVVVLERDAREGGGITARNSGVIHSALYYPPGSLKAELCLRGQALLYDWLSAHPSVPHARLGKLVVALDSAEEEQLKRIGANAHACGATSVQPITGDAARTREPELPSSVTAALWCPLTGIVDAAALTTSFRAAAEEAGALFVFHATVEGIEVQRDGFSVLTTRDAVDCARLVNAAGLYSDRIAAMAGLTEHTIYPCRGDYFTVTPARLFKHLVYPVKAPNAAGLGVHLTLDTTGQHRLGPDVEYVTDRDRFEPAEHKHEAFRIAAERLLGPTSADRLRYDSCGIRPKLRPPTGAAEVDFVVRQTPAGMVQLIGIESPGLTASLAIAERVAALLV